MNVHNQNDILKQYISKLQVDFILIDHGLCPDWSRETHTRRRDTIYLILDGQGSITVNGETIYPQKNNMVLLPKNSTVSLHCEDETCYNKYWIDFIMHFDGVSLFDVIDFPYMIELDDPSRALELVRQLDDLHIQTDAGSAIMMKSILLELVSMFLKNDTREITHKAVDDPFADELKEFIFENLSNDLSVKVLASKMGFNEKYFISLFKQHFNTTPAHYVKTLRLERVKSDLLYSSKPLMYIAYNVGYSNTQKLAKDFKAYTGFSPAEFRRKFKC
jgi:AraC-like DNA-binding protein